MTALGLSLLLLVFLFIAAMISLLARRWGREQLRRRAQLKNLELRNHELTGQLQQRETVFGSMVEGVLALDYSERVTGVNRAACEMLGYSAADILGRPIQEIARDYELLQFVRDALSSANNTATKLERTLALRGSKLSDVQASSSPIVGGGGAKNGVVIVLHDVSQLRRLEGIRREFVANVSHELRTPVTSIKGFVEALQDGGLAQPEQAQRFLSIISRQVSSLLAIIEDLLSLSRIEKESEEGSLLLVSASLLQILAAARDVCLVRAAEKQISIQIECDADLEIAVNATLLEQAIVNLIENAIKYSEAGRLVRVSARIIDEPEHAAEIAVVDQGYGIPEAELPRIFERFYRGDKGRDRKSGSTGLGLAIVKHVVSAHRGRVAVDSTPGVGSKFTIQLPLPHLL